MRTLRFLPLLALLAACSDGTGLGAGAVRMTAMVNGDAPPNGDNVAVTIENRGSRTVQMLLCSDTRVTMVVERRVDGAWEDYGGDACFAVYRPVDLEPGASRAETRAIREGGRFRFELRVWSKDDPESQRTVYSEGFDVP
jgi:hypothetical protein